MLGLKATPNAAASRAASWMEAFEVLTFTSTTAGLGRVLTVPFSDSGVDPSLIAPFLIWIDVVGEIVRHIEIGGDGIAHLNSTNHSVLQLQRAVSRHLSVGIGQIGRTRDHGIGSLQCAVFRNFCAPESETSSISRCL